MPDTTPRTWLIAYDIASPKRLARVHRYLKGEAVPVQYSVFMTRTTLTRIHGIRHELERLIDPRADDVRIYSLPEQLQIDTAGQAALPEGMMLIATGQGKVLPFESKPRRARRD
jgi:CRISPR-associated protein Cas2